MYKNNMWTQNNNYFIILNFLQVKNKFTSRVHIENPKHHIHPLDT